MKSASSSMGSNSGQTAMGSDSGHTAMGSNSGEVGQRPLPVLELGAPGFVSKTVG